MSEIELEFELLTCNCEKNGTKKLSDFLNKKLQLYIYISYSMVEINFHKRG